MLGDMPSSSLARVVRRPNFSWVSTGAPDYSRIAQRYGTTQGDQFGGSAPDEIPNPNLPGTGTANQVQGALNSAQNIQAGNLRAAERMVPNMTPTVVARTSTPGSTTTPMGDLKVQDGQISRDAPVNPTTGEPSAMAAEQQAETLWAAQGGSARTMHRDQSRAGIRPAIDARAPHSPSEVPSDASMAAMRGFGDSADSSQAGHTPFPATKFGTAGSTLWDQMSKNFDSARAKLRANIGGQQYDSPIGPPASMANVTPISQPGGPPYQWPAGQFDGVPDADTGDLTYTPPTDDGKDYY